MQKRRWQGFRLEESRDGLTHYKIRAEVNAAEYEAENNKPAPEWPESNSVQGFVLNH